MVEVSRREADHREYLAYIIRKLDEPGLLLAAPGLPGQPANAMTIGWATFGIIWGLPICVVLVRPSRHTYELIEASQDFTVNVPGRGMEDEVAVFGTKSGRDCDKFAATGLVARPSRTVKAPTVSECVIACECKVVHFNDVTPANLAPQVDASSYPRGDYHRLYYGQILVTTIHPDAEHRDADFPRSERLRD